MGTEDRPGMKVLGAAPRLPLPGQRLRRRDWVVEPDAVKPYDFLRPDKFPKEQIRTMQIIHETFARLATTTLSATLRALAHVRVAAVDQLTYEEFIRSIPAPSLMAIFGMDPLKGSAILEMDHALVFAILDRLFGGKGECAVPSREVTDVEFSVMERVITRILGSLGEAWSPILDLKPRLNQVEEMPQFAQIVRPSEMVILVSIEATIGEARGFMNLCLPYITIEPIVPHLTAMRMFGMAIDRNHGPDRQGLVSSIETAIEAAYEGDRLSLAELAALRPGSLVALKGYSEGRALLLSGDSVLARLAAKGGHGKSKLRYEIVEGRGAADWLSRSRGGMAKAVELEDSLAGALQPLLRELGESRKALDEKITSGLAALGRKQDEMADQLAFSPAGAELPGPASGAAAAHPFDWIKRVDNDLVADFLGAEIPQLAALVLSHLEPQKAALILGLLAPGDQAQVARRIALMDQSPPETLASVEEVLRKKLTVISSSDAIPAGGVDAVVEILGMAGHSTERSIVDSLGRTDPALAEEIKKRLFVFEDINLLDPRSVTKVLARVDGDLLLRALKAASNEARALIWSCVPAAELGGLQRRFEEIGSVRLSEADSAQQKIVALIAEMEGSGEILIARPGESAD